MKHLGEYINEGHFYKLYKKKKDYNFINKLENDLKVLIDKDITCDINFNNQIINLNILNSLKEGIVGHIIENILANVLLNLNTNKYDIKIEKEKHADIEINGELFEIKAFKGNINKETLKVHPGIDFTEYQIENEGYPIIFINYGINDNKIIIKEVYCKYPNDILWSKGTKKGAKVVRLKL